jgi:glycosyltransferase involved in cell wall biosynthesis
MHILFITQYFSPEIGAASERLTGLAFNLSRLGYKVIVITGFPNYPFGMVYPDYKKKLFMQEEINGVRIIRVWFYTTKKTGAVARLLNYLSFMFSSILAGILTKRADFVVATSGPIFTALAGYILSIFKKSCFIFDVRDIWPERIYAGTDIKRGFLIKTLEKLEIFLYKKATKIVAVTNGVRDNIVSKVAHTDKVKVITNGVNTGIFSPHPVNRSLAERLGINEDKFIAIYVGTLGLLQDLHLIIACAEKLRIYKDILFLIVGGGAKRDEFIGMVKENNLTNVRVIQPVLHAELCDYINLADIGINANTNHPHNNMAIPVKMFPYMACAKPVLLANVGEIASLVERYNVGMCVPPGDAEAFTTAILKFYNNRELCKLCGENGYRLVRERFSMDKLARDFSNAVLNN